MALRVCAEKGCPALTRTTRCPEHARERDQARGTRQARGYDADHDRLRAEWAPRVATGTVRCRRCLGRLAPFEPWDLGHPDDDCPRPRAPEHRRCNRATATRRAT